jgi:hypothetical protein
MIVFGIAIIYILFVAMPKQQKKIAELSKKECLTNLQVWYNDASQSLDTTKPDQLPMKVGPNSYVSNQAQLNEQYMDAENNCNK